MKPLRYIIVGAGSAGCVLANRLSADPANEVLLLEAGGRDINPLIHIPAGIAKLVRNQHINWHYNTEPERELHGRRLYWPRGKVLGGSSSINAMCYIRGQPQDYDNWVRAGCAGWGYSDVLPYFKRSERQSVDSPLRNSPFHGSEGPLDVVALRDPNPLSSAFVEAGTSVGHPHNDDFNGPQQEGVGLYQVTQRAGRRCSAAVAFLREATTRPNLRVATRSHVQRIIFDRGRAIGVEVIADGKLRRYHCDGEVILSAGAINSPQLLMLSGIGPAQHVREHGIPLVADRPGVGENLQDHLDICVLHKSPYRLSYDLSPFAELQAALRYALTRRGPLASNIAEAGAFLRSNRAIDARPDIQLHFVPAQLDDHGRNRLPGHGYTVHACFLQPASRGRIRLRSNLAADAPCIHANYLHDHGDMEAMVEAVRLAREILAAPAFDKFRGSELFPGGDITARPAVEDFIRRRAETVYHPAATCSMGNDELAVVDPSLRVRGVDGLRVIDASIMPTLVSGNTNAPTIMIAEKGADLLLDGS